MWAALGGVSLFAMTWPTIAAAQTASTNSAGESADKTAIPEVITTAERRSATVQSVPLAVTVFTARQREIEGINSVQEIADFTPSLTYSDQLDRGTIRGLGRLTNVFTADSSVAIFDNNLISNSILLVDRDDLFVDQITILPGPQNTLYGRNPIGGVINTQSKRPSDVFGGEIRGRIGNYGLNKIEGTVTGPFGAVPGLTYRLSGSFENQRDGYYRNLAGPDEGGVHTSPYVELQLQYKTDRDTIWLEAHDIALNHDRGGPGARTGSLTTGPYDVGLVVAGRNVFNPNAAYLSSNVVPGSITGTYLPNNPTSVHDRVIADNASTDINFRAAWGVDLQWKHHFDGINLEYTGGYSQYNYDLRSGDDSNGGTSINSYQIPTYPLASVPPQAGNYCGFLNAVGRSCAPLTVSGMQSYRLDERPRWFSHEVTVSSTSSGRLSWIGGAYFYHDDAESAQHFASPDQPQLTAVGFNVIPYTTAAAPTTYIGTLFAGRSPALAIFNPSQSGDTQYYAYQSHADNASGFAQLSFKITQDLKLTGGLRYSYDRKSAQEETRQISFNSPALAGLLGQFTPGLDVTAATLSGSPSTAKGVVSPVTYPTTGTYAGDAVRSLKDSSDSVTGTVAAEWTPDRDTLAYARFNRGYKALAFDAGYLAAQPEAAPEKVDDFEIGLKKTIWPNLLVNVSGFYYDYHNLQIPLDFETGLAGGSYSTQTYFTNIPRAIVYGAELSAVYRPIRSLMLSFIYGYNHTDILTGCPTFTTSLTTVIQGCYINPSDPFAVAHDAKPAGPAANGYVYQSARGNALPQSPENKLAFNANYTLFFNTGDLTLSGSYIWRDHSYGTIFQTRQVDYAPSWSQVDVRATWSGYQDRYEVVLYIKNLFDTTGYDSAARGYYNDQPLGGGAAIFNQSYNLTPPRRYGVEFHYRF